MKKRIKKVTRKNGDTIWIVESKEFGKKIFSSLPNPVKNEFANIENFRLIKRTYTYKKNGNSAKVKLRLNYNKDGSLVPNVTPVIKPDIITYAQAYSVGDEPVAIEEVFENSFIPFKLTNLLSKNALCFKDDEVVMNSYGLTSSECLGYGENGIPIQVPQSNNCDVAIKYDWKLADGTYETRYTTIALIDFATTHEIEDGPTVHTTAETPVTIRKDKGYPARGHQYIFDVDRNVHTIILTNLYGTEYKLFNMNGPYDQYSPHLDLNFATNHYFAGSERYGHVVSFNNGDIYRVYWAKTSDSFSPVMTYLYNNQTQIDNVEILSGVDVHPTGVLSINKTITTGTPDTAQVTAEIRIPSQFVCSPTPTPITPCSVTISYMLQVSQSTYTEETKTIQVPSNSETYDIQFDAGTSSVLEGGKLLTMVT